MQPGAFSQARVLARVEEVRPLALKCNSLFLIQGYLLDMAEEEKGQGIPDTLEEPMSRLNRRPTPLPEEKDAYLVLDMDLPSILVPERAVSSDGGSPSDATETDSQHVDVAAGNILRRIVKTLRSCSHVLFELSTQCDSVRELLSVYIDRLRTLRDSPRVAVLEACLLELDAEESLSSLSSRAEHAQFIRSVHLHWQVSAIYIYFIDLFSRISPFLMSSSNSHLCLSSILPEIGSVASILPVSVLLESATRAEPSW